MKIGDVVTYRGVVTDIVEGAILTKSLAHDEREHWFKAEHLSPEGPLVPAPANVIELPAPASTTPEVEKAVSLLSSKGYTEETARKIVDQLGPEALLKGADDAGTKTENLTQASNAAAPTPAAENENQQSAQSEGQSEQQKTE